MPTATKQPPAWLKRAITLRKSWSSKPMSYSKVAEKLRNEGYSDVTGLSVQKIIGP